MYNGKSFYFSYGWLMKNVSLVLLLLVALAIPSVAQTQSNTTKSIRAEAYLHFAKARLAAEQGQLADAITEYKKALELDANNSQIYSEMAETYLRAQQVRNAVTAAQSAVKADPDNVDGHKILASVYASMLSDANANTPVTEQMVN